MKFYLQNIEDFAPRHLLYCFFRLEKKDGDDQTGIKHLHLQQM